MANFRIKVLTAFVAIGEDGDEGVMAFKDLKNNVWMPLVCADEERIQSMFLIAENMIKGTDKKYQVLQFSNRSDITEETQEKFKT